MQFQQPIKCYFLVVTPIITNIKGIIISMLNEAKCFDVSICYHIKVSQPKGSQIKSNFLLPGLKEISVKDFSNVTNSYIFVNTPYIDHFLQDINMTQLLLKNKFLNVNYAYHIHKQLYSITYNHNDFKKFYASFHECEENYNDFKTYIKSCDPTSKVLERAHLSGSTKIEYLKMTQQQLKPMFPNSSSNTTILFSFRWEKQTNNYTGSTFVPYFIKSIQKNTRINYIYRPHPLSKEEALENFVAPNYLVDYENDYKHTFDTSNILISDLSTVISDYFIYRKCPIILLNTENKLTDILNKFGMRIIEGIYVVKTINELEKTLEMLLAGNDPKKEIRIKVADALDVYSPNKYIKEFIKKDRNIK